VDHIHATTNGYVPRTNSICILRASFCMTSTFAIHKRAALHRWEHPQPRTLFYSATIFSLNLASHCRAHLERYFWSLIIYNGKHLQILNICYFVHQCNTFTSYFLLIVDMFRPHTAIFRCYSILSRSCSVMPIFAYVMLPAMWFS
jgi:hypothetical protein